MKVKLIKRFLISSLVLVLLLTTVVTAQVVLEQISVARNTITLQVNNEIVDADNFIYEGRTYVQLRDVAEMLGKDVGWNAETRTASINDPIPTPTPKPLATIKPLETPKPVVTIKPMDNEIKKDIYIPFKDEENMTEERRKIFLGE